MVGIECIREGQHSFYDRLDILQAFVHHYEKVFTVQGPSKAQNQAL